MAGRKRRQKTVTTTAIVNVEGVDDVVVAAAATKKAKVNDDKAKGKAQSKKVVEENVETKTTDSKNDKLSKDEEKAFEDETILEEVKAKTLDVVEAAFDGTSKSVKASKTKAEEDVEEGEDGDEDEVKIWSVTGTTNEEIHDEIKKSLVSNMGVKIFDMLLNDGAHCAHHLASRLNTTTSNPTFFYAWKQLQIMKIAVVAKGHSETTDKPVYRLHYKFFPYGETPESVKALASTDEDHFVSQKSKKKSKSKAKAGAGDDAADAVKEEHKENEVNENEEGSSEAASSTTATDSKMKDATTNTNATSDDDDDVEEGEIKED